MNKYIDHTNLKPYATTRDIIVLCEEALYYNFRAVCVHPSWVSLAAKALENTDIKIAAVIGFPLGANCSIFKLAEAIDVIKKGANEIDMVWNLGLFKDGKYLKVRDEIAKIVELDVPVKVIVETCYLNTDELGKAYQIVRDSGADCIKTSTGFGPEGAEYSIVELWKSLGDLRIKAAGSIKSYDSAKKFIEVGADYLGTSHGVAIMQGEKDANSKLH